MSKTKEIIVDYQNYIDFPRHALPSLYSQACSNDKQTIESWQRTWLSQVETNHKEFGPFLDRGIGKLWGRHQNLPMIIAGSGPSLKENGHLLKDRGGIPLISCLHNFHFFEDLEVPVDYYVSLDAGPVTIEEVSEGGSKTADEYWALTKNRTLLCFIGTHPDLLRKWQGEVYFFNCPIPDMGLMKKFDDIEYFHTYVSNGGNVLGACFYIAKAILGSQVSIFVGVNYSFSYQDKFHAWDSKYDENLGHYLKMTDVYGNKVKTWQSYANFKAWHDYICESVPGIYINCSEGGCLGSTTEGNIRSIRQMDLSDCLRLFSLNNELKEQCFNPLTTEPPKVLF